MEPCEVCGCSSFEEKDGFLFCTSCCTQSQNYVEMEVETDGQRVNKTILADETKIDLEKQSLTTWEEYNYVLVGLVNQLIELGAKEEIKVTALQLWTEYLRKAEAAFFSKTNIELPRLPYAYKNKDATILYDKKLVLRMKTKRKKSSIIGAKARRKRQKKIIESEYNDAASSVKGSSNSSVSIPLIFTSNARKVLKAKMDEKHIEFHENADIRPKCHKQLVMDKQNKIEHTAARILISIMYIALNKVNDKIQLGDMIRWFREGHLSVLHVERFFPANYKLARRMVEQMGQIAVMSHLRCRANALIISQFINISSLNRPDFTQLCRRYVNELCLPDAVYKYAERLIRLYPPVMERTITEMVPNYEGRAMAYIIFVLKLLFGLNGVTEELLSDSAERVNRIICKEKLFNFREWMHFVELRKIVISQYHFPTQLSIGTASTNRSHLFINHMNSVQTTMENIDKKPSFPSKVIEPLLKAMLKVADIHEMKEEKLKHKSFKFHPSLTPSSDYLSQLLNKYNINAPKLLNKNFQQAEFCFIKKNLLRRTLYEKHGVNLKFRKINIKAINMNLNLSKHILHRGNDDIIRKFNTKRSWIEVIHKRKKLSTLDRMIENVVQSTLNSTATPKNKKQAETKLISENVKLLINENNHGFENESIEKNLSDSETEQLEETHDFETESEFTYENNLQTDGQLQPNRNLESNLLIFDNQSDDESSDNENCCDKDKEIEFYLPNFYYWRRICYIGINVGEYYEEVERELPKSFNWLVHECARITENSPHELYSELLTVEAGFTSFMKPLTKKTTRVKFMKLKKNKKKSKYWSLISNLCDNW